MEFSAAGCDKPPIPSRETRGLYTTAGFGGSSTVSFSMVLKSSILRSKEFFGALQLRSSSRARNKHRPEPAPEPAPRSGAWITESLR